MEYQSPRYSSHSGKILADWEVFTTADLAQGYFHVPAYGILQKLFSSQVVGHKFKYNCLLDGLIARLPFILECVMHWLIHLLWFMLMIS